MNIYVAAYLIVIDFMLLWFQMPYGDLEES